jgi:hypothetical protein
MVENFAIKIIELEKNFVNNKNEEELNLFYDDLNKELENQYSNIDSDFSNYDSENDNLQDISDDMSQLSQIFYEEYNLLTVKELNHIINYYNLKKLKNKSETIWKIIEYETNIDNIYLTEKRKELWKYINELKKDKYLSKFITI